MAIKNDVPNELRPYFLIRNELSVHQNQIFRGRRVLVPVSVRKKLSDLAHEGHLGIQTTNEIAMFLLVA